ncbi:hypothetical protein CKAH01_17227 [Colletotrichum kahawae]|uniref:Uncharacterized protein n=1 Tax=Colletotrichum kahawae TaxID=34407 RepID=A0AAE0D768_COLKA|nr:hypothetical protein CKAH01_17227 [Colletotrichum kahawae]
MPPSSTDMNEQPSSSGIITPASSSNMTDFSFHPDSTFVSSQTPMDMEDDVDACMHSSLDEKTKDDGYGKLPINQPLRITHANCEMVPKFNVRFLWVNKVEESWAETQNSIRWEANLYVQARDVGQLMREGFYLSADREVKDTGCIAQNICPGEPNYGGWKHTRHYIFTDSDMKWTAHLHVYVSQMAELARFRLADLKPSQLVFSWAYNPDGFRVYGYSLFNPEDNFNTICEDMPMEGIWPWPKERRIHPSIPAGTSRTNDDKVQKGKKNMYESTLPPRVKEDAHSRDPSSGGGKQLDPYDGVPPSLRPVWQHWQPGFTPPVFHYPLPPPYVPKE